jgi:hypothetical protein
MSDFVILQHHSFRILGPDPGMTVSGGGNESNVFLDCKVVVPYL